ncbi:MULTISPECIES: tetratricopeptide repeat protein [Sphingobacterium]|uniref:Tetratricopeptide repeat protein n=1 Tax=Sphingobacterium populi TaxID=1812824 RepID=A0ABW5UGU9_9SPHI|nr:tetratricopeptide repeat protein [Sphingobacterium sp. CFCC 11742]
MKKPNNISKFILTFGLAIGGLSAFAQSAVKEATNNFALYTQTGELKHLESAKKFIDGVYKTRRDSANTRINLTRVMIYSSIAYADSTRKISTEKDPIDITLATLDRLSDREKNTRASEMAYVTQNLAAAYTYKANQALQAQEYDLAYQNFLRVKELQPKNEDIIYNLGLLANQTNRTDEAIQYYEQAITLSSRQPIQYLELAQIYEKKNQHTESRKILEKGSANYPNNKEILFKLIETYSQQGNYGAIVPIAEHALKMEPENVDLNYLVGFSFENAGNIEKAKQYYERTVQLNDNNYEANLALGLLYLQQFMQNQDDHEAQYTAQNYLLKANEIRPHEVNALRSLAMYYENTEDDVQLDRVNLLLNRLQNY